MTEERGALIEAMARAIERTPFADLNAKATAARVDEAISSAGFAIVPVQVAECEPMPSVDDDGWCEWIHPLPGYLMQCCDCRLIHEMEYAIVPSHENCGDGSLNEGETKDGIIIFRARRANPLTTKGTNV